MERQWSHGTAVQSQQKERVKQERKWRHGTAVQLPGTGETMETWNSCTTPGTGETMETWNSCTVARNRRDSGDMEQLYSCQEQERQWRHGTAVQRQEQERQWRHGTAVQLPGTGETLETWNSCTVARNRRDSGDMEQLYSCQEQERQWRHGTAVQLPGTGETVDMEQLYSCQEQERQWRHGTAVQLPGTGETMETWNSCTVARRVRMMGERF